MLGETFEMSSIPERVCKAALSIEASKIKRDLGNALIADELGTFLSLIGLHDEFVYYEKHVEGRAARKIEGGIARKPEDLHGSDCRGVSKGFLKSTLLSGNLQDLMVRLGLDSEFHHWMMRMDKMRKKSDYYDSMDDLPVDIPATKRFA